MNYYPYYSPYGAQNRAQYGVPTYGGYNYTPQPQQAQSMPQNQPQAQQQYEMPIQDIRFVTAEEAKAFIVMPNSRVLLIDKNGMAYLKTADNMGQSQTQCFRFEAVNADGSAIKAQEQPTQPDFKDFVKLQDVHKLGFATVEEVQKLSNSLDELKRSLQPRQKVEAQK